MFYGLISIFEMGKLISLPAREDFVCIKSLTGFIFKSPQIVLCGRNVDRVPTDSFDTDETQSAHLSGAKHIAGKGFNVFIR